MTDERGDESRPVPPPPSEPEAPQPFEPSPDPDPIQVAPPENWPPAAAPIPIGAPLGERPLPDLAPLPPARPRRTATAQPSPMRQPAPPRRRSLLTRALLLVGKLVLAIVIGSVLLVLAYRFVGPPVTLTMVGDFVSGRGVVKQWVPLSSIDPVMARAAIAAEDSGFCSHNGFDLKAIEQAYARNQKGGRIRGGSTISQQTAKNVFLWQGGGYFRKGLEAWFTFLIENLWGKRRIMEVYLNVAETGIGTYGVEAGAKRYFGHGAGRLTPQEAAQIAAVLPLPKKRAGTDPRGFTRRYGRAIAARIATVRRDGLDACVR